MIVTAWFKTFSEYVQALPFMDWNSLSFMFVEIAPFFNKYAFVFKILSDFSIHFVLAKLCMSFRFLICSCEQSVYTSRRFVGSCCHQSQKYIHREILFQATAHISLQCQNMSFDVHLRQFRMKNLPFLHKAWATLQKNRSIRQLSLQGLFLKFLWKKKSGKNICAFNTSLGGYGNSKEEEKMIDSCYENNIMPVVAAGNENYFTEKFSPSFWKNALTISALAQNSVYKNALHKADYSGQKCH